MIVVLEHLMNECIYLRKPRWLTLRRHASYRTFAHSAQSA